MEMVIGMENGQRRCVCGNIHGQDFDGLYMAALS
jgi:hypothetical protein